jgi:Na+:H+ antiporter, NhaA family
MSSSEPTTSRDPLVRFISLEALAGLILVLAAVAALAASNLAVLQPLYDDLLTLPLTVRIGGAELSKPLLLWINDGLMAVFFLLVGLELKREVLTGHLRSADQIVLPAACAVGGMAVPALVYLAITQSLGSDPELIQGWAIPAATDIAFALGALALLGSRIPANLKVFLLTLATLDDLGAIVVIAIFYTADLSLTSLALAGLAIVALAAMSRLGVTRLAPYIFVGIALWVFVLKSGVHATLAGVALGFAIPMRDRGGKKVLEALEDGLHPYVTWGILPVFAFANAGLSLAGLGPSSLLAPLPLAIAAGLVVGKPLGILAAALAMVRLRLAHLPEAMTWMHLTGLAALAGIGFTMSLFIGMLAFEADEHAAGVRIGVIAGSLVSALVGYLVLRFGTAGKT